MRSVYLTLDVWQPDPSHHIMRTSYKSRSRNGVVLESKQVFYRIIYIDQFGPEKAEVIPLGFLSGRIESDYRNRIGTTRETRPCQKAIEFLEELPSNRSVPRAVYIINHT
jgi:hypothetical protein